MKNAKRRTTAQDVAQFAGTSQSAVSRVFTPGASVSTELRKRILKAANELGYRPNAFARSLITRRSGMVAVTMAMMHNPYNAKLIEVLTSRLQDQGYQVLLFSAPHGSSASLLLEQIMQYQVEAVILGSTGLSPLQTSECQLAGVPIIMFNPSLEDTGISMVLGENERAGEMIGDFLVKGGHKRMAFVSGHEGTVGSHHREVGFTRAVVNAGLPEPIRVNGDYDIHTTAKVMRDLLNRRDRPDAVFCANDSTAITCLDVARYEFGLKVPDDISIVGFDDMPQSRLPGFDLTTYAQPVTPFVDLTIGIVNDFVRDPSQAPRRITVAGEFLIRGTARIPDGMTRRPKENL
ncbi:LacI family DNA-binding transcriptional regulator [Brucella sp. BE17]|uniref:LacI family DNA-binding transcriptional regulator n=1 Tax=Brucella sp. BE17 TaxID=3142977 RepID=UPI0031BB6816